MKSMQLHCLDLGSELIIAAGKRKFSYQSRHVPVKCLLDRQNGRHAEKTRSKRCLTSSDSSGSEVTQKRAKRQVISTRRELNKEHRCLEWLECDRDEHWCDVCRRYKEKLQGMRNYTGIWVSGSTNHKTSNIADHASSDQHLAVMQRLDMERKRAQGIPQVDYSPIIQCMTRLNEDERKKLKGKFEICYMLARESLAFVEYVPLHALSERHEVSLGQNYKTPDSAKLFTHCIAESQRKSLYLQKCKNKVKK